MNQPWTWVFYFIPTLLVLRLLYHSFRSREFPSSFHSLLPITTGGLLSVSSPLILFYFIFGGCLISSPRSKYRAKIAEPQGFLSSFSSFVSCVLSEIWQLRVTFTSELLSGRQHSGWRRKENRPLEVSRLWGDYILFCNFKFDLSSDHDGNFFHFLKKNTQQWYYLNDRKWYLLYCIC